MNLKLTQLRSGGAQAILVKRQSTREAMCVAVKQNAGYAIAVRKKGNNAKLKFRQFDCADVRLIYSHNTKST
ncbi:MAG TPA: hypothetical protein VIF82_15900 [Burkholderiaceae bacterium]